MKRTKKAVMQWDITKAGASRALYQGVTETPRMQFFLTASNGQELELEMDIATAHTLIEQLISTYYIIRPELRTNRRTFNG